MEIVLPVFVMLVLGMACRKGKLVLSMLVMVLLSFSHHSGDGNHSSGGRLRHGNETGTAKALPPDHFNQTLYSGGHGNGHPLYGTPAHWHKPACGHRHHHLHVSAGTFQHADLFEKRGRKCLCFHHQLPLLHRDDTDLCDGSGEGCVVIFYST